METFQVSEVFKRTWPGGAAGILVMHDVANPPQHQELEARKSELENGLRSRYHSRQEIAASPILQAYDAYYKRFKKTYHVQLQVESVALKGKSLPRVAALVEAMFMAELKNMLLTAGHDLTTLQLPITLDVASGSEQYTLLNGQVQSPKADDMMMLDGQGIISSVLYGPDRRSSITPESRHVLFAVYAAPGLPREAVQAHLQDIESNVRLIAPTSRTELLQVFGTAPE